MRKKRIARWKISAEDKKDLLTFLDQLELGKVNRGVKISQARQLKYLDALKTPLQFFNKPSSKLTLKDVEAFEKALTSDSIQSARGKPFAHSTKKDLRRLLSIYLKWKLGDTERYRNLCGWFDTRDVFKTPDFLSEQQIQQLYDACQTAEHRYLVCMLFDSGMRASEFHNLRFEDIQLPQDKDNFVRITIKEEYSKTLGRVISLYWKHTLQAIREYLDLRIKQGIRPHDPIFVARYDNARWFLARLGRRVLGRSIYYHLFRHSSATYYASKLNRQQLCYRYGWRFSSDMPDVYISRAGMENAQIDEHFQGTEIETLKMQLEKYQQESQLAKEWRIRVEENLDKRSKLDHVKTIGVKPSDNR